MIPMRLDHLIHDEIRSQVSDTQLRALDDSQSAFESVDVESLAPWSYDLLMLNTSLRAFATRIDRGAPGTVADAMVSAALFAATTGPDDDDEDEDEDDEDEDDSLVDDEEDDEEEEETEEVSLEDLEEKDEDDPASTDFGAMDDDEDDELSLDDDDDDDDDLFDDE